MSVTFSSRARSAISAVFLLGFDILANELTVMWAFVNKKSVREAEILFIVSICSLYGSVMIQFLFETTLNSATTTILNFTGIKSKLKLKALLLTITTESIYRVAQWGKEV